MAVIDGKTTAPSYVTSGPAGGAYDLSPLLTAGDEVPLLEGDFPNFTTSSTKTFALPGIPDGLGIYNYVFVNQEILATRGTASANLQTPNNDPLGENLLTLPGTQANPLRI